jgi:hypothetical protein
MGTLSAPMGTLSTHMGHRSRGIGHSEYSHRVLGVLTSGTRSAHIGYSEYSHRPQVRLPDSGGGRSRLARAVGRRRIPAGEPSGVLGVLTHGKYSEYSHRALGVLASGYSLPDMIM